jgi:hypothetical protein
MSHQRWRKSIAPGVSPGLAHKPKGRALEEGGRKSLSPLRGSGFITTGTPGSRPGLPSAARFASWLTYLLLSVLVHGKPRFQNDQ